MALLEDRKPITHVLKTCSKWFNSVFLDMKQFEIRLHDRDYRVWDHIIIQEWDVIDGDFQPTGREVAKQIMFMMPAGEFEGLAGGYCALGLRKPKQNEDHLRC